MRTLRVARGWTQTELARRAGTTQTRLCEIEKDRCAPSDEALGRIAEALGCPMEALDLRRVTVEVDGSALVVTGHP